MRIFLAGATGAIGRPLVPKLVAAGHEVTALSRSEEKAAALREAGVTPVVADVFDAERVQAAMKEAAPEVVLHQLTALPDRMDFRKEETFAPTNRLRSEGTQILLAGAREAGAGRFVCQSIAFAYAPEGDWLKEEDAPLVSGERRFGLVGRILGAMERAVTEADGMEGVVLRYGAFYGPGTYYAADGGTAEEVRKRRLPVVGRGTGMTSFVHVEDASDATVLAVDRGAPGIYNVVDDEPAPMREWLPVFAKAIGAPKPLRVPSFVVRLAAGAEAATLATEMRGASNAKAKSELGWEPAHRTWREGFARSSANPRSAGPSSSRSGP